MTPQQFIQKWLNSRLKEKAAAQEHFIDLCKLLSEKTPADSDPSGQDYGFEVGATKTTGGRGFADVFKRGFFAWEYKGTHANLDNAFAQLQRYAVALDNPPLLIVSDVGTIIRIHTNWTNSVSKTYDIAIAELDQPEKREWLKLAFTDPDSLKPKKTRQQLTEEVAAEFAALAESLRSKGHDAEQVAHFINRLVFCMFAEDVKLLPDRMFVRMLDRALEDPNEFVVFAADLFRAMSSGGRVGFEKVAWFNGGLFNDDAVFPLSRDEIKLVHKAASQYWGDVDPSILGTLFERGLDPRKRGQLGAHYTDRDKIMMIVTPVIAQPLSAAWETTKGKIEEFLYKASEYEEQSKRKGGRAASAAIGQATVARNEAQALLDRYLKMLADFRVLDPACGSGNFLYLALRVLKDLEHKAQVEAEALGLPRKFPSIGPEVVKGIEINPFAAELARVSIWIGEIQWMLKNGFPAGQNPVLKPLETIECRDALVSGDVDNERVEAEWPPADVVIGNPPFLGSRKLVPELGKGYVDDVRRIYKKAVPRGADLVCFWFAKAWELSQAGRLKRVGLIATNSISGGSSRRVLEPIANERRLFAVWRDQPWIVEGAAVDVHIVCFSSETPSQVTLNGNGVEQIFADLHAPSHSNALDLTQARVLAANKSIAFQGIVPRSNVNKKLAKKLGLSPASFALTRDSAREMLTSGANANGISNSEVIFPYLVGDDITKRPKDRFIVDFDLMSEREAELFEKPFAYISSVKKHRRAMNQPDALATWWQHWRTRPDMRSALKPLSRFIATPRVSKYRVFVWCRSPTLPDNAVVVIARDDDTTFGILQSKFHRIWALRKGTSLQNRPRYTPTTTFSTFPFPVGLTPDLPAEEYASDRRAQAIAEAAGRLDRLRNDWLTPADLVHIIPEEVAGLPPRLIPKDNRAAGELKKRTLVSLYNQEPPWLKTAHRSLDEAVARAYDWPVDEDDDAVLQRLLNENLKRPSSDEQVVDSDEELEEEDGMVD